MDLFRTRSIGDLVQNYLGNLDLRAGNPSYAPVVDSICVAKLAVTALSPSFSIRRDKAAGFVAPTHSAGPEKCKEINLFKGKL